MKGYGVSLFGENEKDLKGLTGTHKKELFSSVIYSYLKDGALTAVIKKICSVLISK